MATLKLDNVNFVGSAADQKISAHNDDATAHPSSRTIGGQTVAQTTMTGDVTLTTADQVTQQFVPDADRNVTLPAETAGTSWAGVLCHVGSGAYVLTIKRAGGTTLGTIPAGDAALVTWNGTSVKMF